MNPIEKYFYAEKYESVFFVLVGIMSILVAIYFFVKVKQAFYNGMAYPLIAVALIQIIVGSSVYFRCSKDIVRVTEIVQTDKAKIQTEEIPRMKIVMNNFVIYRWVEFILLIIGMVMFIYFPKNSILKGIGLGLFIQSGFMLLLDFFAESRGRVYLDYLQSIG